MRGGIRYDAINRADDAHGHQPSWEVNLALPYGWWNFREEQMLGIRMIAWSFLPIEEVNCASSTAILRKYCGLSQSNCLDKKP